MKISELPYEIKKVALKHQKNSKTEGDDLLIAFLWYTTIEGNEFWRGWHKKKAPLKNNLESNNY